jgi:tetratricopeptide (TPR) repeat protein
VTAEDVAARLVQLADAYRALADSAAAAASAGDPQAIGELDRLLAAHDQARTTAAELRAQLVRAHRAATETERLVRLRDAALPDAADLALALLRGDWITARDGLRRIAAHGEGKLAELALVMAAAIQALVDAAPTAVKIVEDAVRRIDRAARPAEAEPIRGALLIWLGRLYRDRLASRHLAEAAFTDARAALPDQPEPVVELAELARRARQLEAAQRGFQQAIELAEHRAGAYLGLAAMHEDAGAWLEAARYVDKGIRIIAQELDPVDALDRVAPAPLGNAYLRLGELVKLRNTELAIRALDRALAHRVQGAKHPLAEVYRERGRLMTPPDADNLYAAGQRFLWRGELEDAQACLEEAVAARPGFADALLLLSDNWRMRAYETGRSPQDRASCLQRALAYSDRGLALIGAVDQAWVLTARGYVLGKLAEDAGDPDDPRLWETIALAEHALILEPGGAFHLTAASRFHRRRGNLETANALLATARQVAPGDANVLEDSVRVFANTSEFDEALKLIPQLPDTAWRRGVDAFIRLRQRRSQADLELAKSYLESALQSPDPNGTCWMSIALGMCLYHLKQPEAARARFAIARDAAVSHAERAETALWCGELDVAALIAAEGRRQSPEEYTDLTAMLAIARLGAGELDEARAAFTELIALVSGPAAANWRTYLADDVALLPGFAALSEAAQALRAEVVAALAQRAEVRTPAPTPRAEIERQVASAASARALTLARARLVLADGDEQLAYELYAGLGADHAGRDGAARVAGLLAARAAEAGEPRYLAEGAGFVARHLKTARQAAVVIEHADDDAAVAWLADHWGLTAPPRDPAPLVLTMPTELGPAQPEQSWSFLRDTLPEVRRILQHRFGPTIPWIVVRLEPDAGSTCRLWLGATEVAAIDVDADGEAVPIEKALGPSAPPALAPYTRIGAWLVQVISGQLANLVGLHEVATMVDAWAAPGGEPLIRRTGHLMKLTRLVRALLGEQIAIAPWQSVTDATRRWRKRSLEGLIAHARLQLRSALAAALERNPGPRVWVPWDVERRVAALVHHDGGTEYFAAPAAEVEELLAQLRPLVERAPAPALVVRGREARSWVRRVLALEAPAVLVVAQEELQVAGVEISSVKTADELAAPEAPP